MKKVLLLGVTISASNLGVVALAKGALRLLNESFPGSDIVLLDYAKTSETTSVEIAGRRLDVEMCNLRFSWKIWMPNNIAVLILIAAIARASGPRLGAWLIRKNKWLREIAAADRAFAVSGGDSFSDIYGLGRLLYVALPQILVLLLRVELELLPQTIGPFKRRAAFSIGRTVLQGASRVLSRDREGVSVARSIVSRAGVADHIKFAPDLGILLEPRRPEAFDFHELERVRSSRRLLVGVNVSGLLAQEGYREGMFRFGIGHLELMRGIVEHLVKTKGAVVVLVPHVGGEEAESDLPATATVYDGLPPDVQASVVRIDQLLSANETKYIIGLSDIFVGARMHACIAALSQGIPAIGIAYSRKFVGVFESFGVGDCAFDATSKSLDDVIELTDRTVDHREQIRTLTARRAAEMRAELLGVLVRSEGPEPQQT